MGGQTESCDFTIQIKPLEQTFCIILFTTQDLQKKWNFFCEFFSFSITRSERVNIKLKLTLQAADEYTNNTGNPVIRKPRGLYIYYGISLHRPVSNQVSRFRLPIEWTNHTSSTCSRCTALENGREPWSYFWLVENMARYFWRPIT